MLPETEAAIRAYRVIEKARRESVPPCSSCSGRCSIPAACQVPEPAPVARRRIHINPFALFGAIAGAAAAAACVVALGLF